MWDCLEWARLQPTNQHYLRTLAIKLTKVVKYWHIWKVLQSEGMTDVEIIAAHGFWIHPLLPQFGLLLERLGWDWWGDSVEMRFRAFLSLSVSFFVFCWHLEVLRFWTWAHQILVDVLGIVGGFTIPQIKSGEWAEMSTGAVSSYLDEETIGFRGERWETS